MLELRDESTMSPTPSAMSSQIEQQWEYLESKAELSIEAAEFFAKSGPKSFEEQREFERHYLRCKAIMSREGTEHAIYMRDCSRAGMGLISPVQLFPREQIRVLMNSERTFSLEVTRCRRVQAKSYECGTIFVLKK